MNSEYQIPHTDPHNKWPTIECWLGSFVIFRGSGSILLGNPICLRFFRGGGVQTPCPPMIRPCDIPFYANSSHPCYLIDIITEYAPGI